MIDIQAIRAAAEAATAQPWIDHGEGNMPFICMMTPEVIKGLCDEIERLRTALSGANSVASEQPAVEPEMHDAKCPALTGGDCECSESPAFVDKPWARFCGQIGRGPDAPYPGMIDAFEQHYSQSFADRDWWNEASVWAASWKAAKAHTAPQAQQPDARTAAIQECIDRLVRGGKPAEAQMLRHHFGVDT